MHAQDYEREARWRSEVVGNLVVGDAVDLRLPSDRTFLGLYAAGKAELPALLIVHGLGGSAKSPYTAKAAHAAAAAGLSSLRLNLRGADLLGEDYYHAGMTADLAAAIASPELALASPTASRLMRAAAET